MSSVPLTSLNCLQCHVVKAGCLQAVGAQHTAIIPGLHGTDVESGIALRAAVCPAHEPDRCAILCYTAHTSCPSLKRQVYA